MRKKINGSRYDTDTAKKIAHWESDQDYTGLTHCEETLYRLFPSCIEFSTFSAFRSGMAMPAYAFQIQCPPQRYFAVDSCAAIARVRSRFLVRVYVSRRYSAC